MDYHKLSFLITLLTGATAFVSMPSYPSQNLTNLSNPAKIDAISDSFSVSQHNHCKVHNPFPRQNETVTWSGKCEQGYAYGEGIANWYEYDERYAKETGFMMKGKLEGYVVTEFLKGDQFLEGYQGDIVEGNRQGYGTYTYSDGSIYAGQFKNNKQTGYGKLFLSFKRQYAINRWQKQNIGEYVGDTYVIEGIFENSDFIVECYKQECLNSDFR